MQASAPPFPAPAAYAAALAALLAPCPPARWPLALRHQPASLAFFDDPAASRERAGDDEAFGFQVLAVLLGRHAREGGLALAHAPRALFQDATSLASLHAEWRLALARSGAEPASPQAFLDTYLLPFCREPEALRRFLAPHGFLRPATPREVPAPFTPTLVTWEARRAAQAAWMAERLAKRRPGLYVNNAEPSISKTGAALALMAAHPRARFLYLAPSHALLLDVRERAIEAGIPPEEIFVAQGLERLCSFSEGPGEVARDLARGIDIRKRYCEPGGRCGERERCGWHRQKGLGKASRLLLAPSAYLATPSHFSFLLSPAWGNDTRDAIFIDEDAVDRLSLRRSLPTSTLLACLEVVRACEGQPGGYRERLAGLIERLVGFARDEHVDCLQLPTGVPPADPSRWRDERRQVRAAFEGLADEDGLERVLAIEPLLTTPTPPNPLYKDGHGTAYAFDLVPPLPRRPIFFLDGTAVPAFYRQALRLHGEPEFLLDASAGEARAFVAPAGRIIQVVDAGTSRTRLRMEGSLDALSASIRGFVTRRQQAAPGRRTLLVTYMDRPDAAYEGRFRAGLADLGVEVAHYGAIRGLDAFAGWDVVVVGTHRLAPEAYREAARTLLGAEAIAPGTELALCPLPTRQPTTYAVPVERFRDPALQLVFEQRTLGELVQAIARSRVLVPGNEAVCVVAYTELPLPGLLVEPTTLAAFDRAQGSPAANRVGGSPPPPGGVEDLVKRALALKASLRKQAPAS